MIPLVKTNLPPRDVLMPELEKVIYSGYIAQGEQVDEFERLFQAYIGAGLSLSLNSGTAALHMALLLSGVKEGDVVVSTPMTAEPTNIAIKIAGAKIRYADVDPRNGLSDPSSVEKLIDERVKAIMVVDYAGMPVDIAAFQKIEKKYAIPVIEDAAHALGAKYRGQMIGSHFSKVIFSLQAIKHLTTADGGILQLPDQKSWDAGRLMRWFGIDKKLSRMDNNIQSLGFKYHMNNVNATIGLVQMRYIRSVVDRFVDNGRFYDRKLAGVPGLEIPYYNEGAEPSYWLYTLKAERRDDLAKKLQEHGIMASELHKRNDSHDFLRDFPDVLPGMDEFYGRLLHIPCGWWVNGEDRERIVDVIKSGW